MLDVVLKPAMELATGLFWPLCQEIDKSPPELIGDQIKVHPSERKLLEECDTGGWIGDDIPFEWGGQQLPQMIGMGTRFIFCAANYSAAAYTGLTTGAARLILNFGKEDLKKTYLPKMLSGKWQGTMALTEPEAGSSLADITTMTEPTDHGYYKLRGQKIFYLEELQETIRKAEKFVGIVFFFEYELPKTQGLASRLMHSDGLTVEITPELFSD